MVTTKIIARITNKLLGLSRTGGGLLVRKRPTRCGCGTDSAVFLQYAVARLSSPLGIASMSAQVKLRRIFELPPNNGKGAADRKRLPSAAKPLRATSGQIAFGSLEKFADGRIAIAHRRPRDVAGWSRPRRAGKTQAGSAGLRAPCATMEARRRSSASC